MQGMADHAFKTPPSCQTGLLQLDPCVPPMLADRHLYGVNMHLSQVRFFHPHSNGTQLIHVNALRTRKQFPPRQEVLRMRTRAEEMGPTLKQLDIAARTTHPIKLTD